MMTTCLFLLLFQVADRDEYGTLSKACGLDRPDAMMRQGRYLEAAVEYRSRLLREGGRPSIRIPFAFACLGTGDIDYAGKQIRCAQFLFPRFDHFRFDPGTLFSSPENWKDLLQRAEGRIRTPDGWYFLSYAHTLSGDPVSAQKALQKYVRWRGSDESAVAMDHLIRGDLLPKETEVSPDPVRIVSPGRPRTTGGTYLYPRMEWKEEENVDRKK